MKYHVIGNPQKRNENTGYRSISCELIERGDKDNVKRDFKFIFKNSHTYEQYIVPREVVEKEATRFWKKTKTGRKTALPFYLIKQSVIRDWSRMDKYKNISI